MTINNFYSGPSDTPNEIHVIRVSDEERMRGQPSMAMIREAILALNRDGIVVVENAVEMAHVDKLRERMMKDTYELLSRETTHYNFDDKEIANVSQVLPIFPGYIFKDVLANPITSAVISAMIGPRSEFRWMFGNTAVKSERRQPVHADVKWDYWDFPFGMVTNLMLQDVTPENGATEIWLGSHKTTSLNQHVQFPDKDRGRIHPAQVEKRRAFRPPIYPCVKKGSLILRDVRLWHAGMPNHTDIPRIMVGFINFPNWYENPMRCTFPKSAKKEIEQFCDEVVFVADYVEDSKYDHLNLEFNYEYAPIGESSFLDRGPEVVLGS